MRVVPGELQSLGMALVRRVLLCCGQLQQHSVALGLVLDTFTLQQPPEMELTVYFCLSLARPVFSLSLFFSLSFFLLLFFVVVSASSSFCL